MTGQNAAPLCCRLARQQEAPDIVAFLDAHWGSKHPLVHLPEYLDFYYRPFGDEGPLQFAVAEREDRLLAVAGYIRANRLEHPDIWVSIWCAAKGENGAGLELMAALPDLTGARLVACNNIRPKTMVFYRFLGYTAERLPHFYRLAKRDHYTVARIVRRVLLPAGGRATLRLLPDEAALAACGYLPDPARRPYKDVWYLTRRYYHYPHQRYDVWAVQLDGAVKALLVTRCVPVDGAAVLRILDYSGPPAVFAELGKAIGQLMQDAQAEYADCYCSGIDKETMAAAGFCERLQEDENILPNYLTPPLYENSEYYYFTSNTENFTMFKADGDQDRPNLSVE